MSRLSTTFTLGQEAADTEEIAVARAAARRLLNCRIVFPCRMVDDKMSYEGPFSD